MVATSYLTLLRWIFWQNLANSFMLVAFVLEPKLVENVPDYKSAELGTEQAIGPHAKPVLKPESNPAQT